MTTLDMKGQWEHTTQNDNGERLCEFSQLNGLIITGTLFPHKDIHKATWTSADGRVSNQIDHLLISGQWRSSVQDCRVQRGADTNSDHYLVRTKIKLRLSSHRSNKKAKPRLDVRRLKDEDTRKKYYEAVRTKLEENRTESEDIEEVWEHQKNAYVKAAEEVLGYRKGKNKPWISEDSWKLIDERKHIKTRINSTRSQRIQNRLKETYREKDKEVKRSVREDKRRCTERTSRKGRRGGGRTEYIGRSTNHPRNTKGPEGPQQWESTWSRPDHSRDA